MIKNPFGLTFSQRRDLVNDEESEKRSRKKDKQVADLGWGILDSDVALRLHFSRDKKHSSDQNMILTSYPRL